MLDLNWPLSGDNKLEFGVIIEYCEIEQQERERNSKREREKQQERERERKKERWLSDD
jgi:hypothetical protein